MMPCQALGNVHGFLHQPNLDAGDPVAIPVVTHGVNLASVAKPSDRLIFLPVVQGQTDAEVILYKMTPADASPPPRSLPHQNPSPPPPVQTSHLQPVARL